MTTLLENVETRQRAATIRVAIVEDSPLVRKGILGLLSEDSSISVVGEASSAREAIGLIVDTQPDVALVDIRLEEGTGIEVARAIRVLASNTKIVILSAYAADEYVAKVADLGVSGYLTKDGVDLQLARTVHAAAEGWLCFAPSVAPKVRELLSRKSRPESERPGCARNLTSREAEVLRHVSQGLRNIDVAEALGISPKTVEAHLESARIKLGVKNTIQAVLALRDGQLGPQGEGA